MASVLDYAVIFCMEACMSAALRLRWVKAAMENEQLVSRQLDSFIKMFTVP